MKKPVKSVITCHPSLCLNPALFEGEDRDENDMGMQPKNTFNKLPLKMKGLGYFSSNSLFFGEKQLWEQLRGHTLTGRFVGGKPWQEHESTRRKSKRAIQCQGGGCMGRGFPQNHAAMDGPGSALLPDRPRPQGPATPRRYSSLPDQATGPPGGSGCHGEPSTNGIEGRLAMKETVEMLLPNLITSSPCYGSESIVSAWAIPCGAWPKSQAFIMSTWRRWRPECV